MSDIEVFEGIIESLEMGAFDGTMTVRSTQVPATQRVRLSMDQFGTVRLELDLACRERRIVRVHHEDGVLRDIDFATTKFCGVCGLPQWKTHGGLCCDNGHGGAESITKAEAKERGLEVTKAVSDPQPRDPETLLECMQAGYIPPPKPPEDRPRGSWSDKQRQDYIQARLAEGMELWEAINRSAWREIDDIMDARFMSAVEAVAADAAEGEA